MSEESTKKTFSSTVETAIGFVEIKGQLQRIEDTILSIKEKSEEMAGDLHKIKEAIYNPDQGIYTRLKELENWKSNITRIIWISATVLIGVITLAAWELLKHTK